MLDAFSAKKVVVFAPQAAVLNGAATMLTAIDTRGFDYVEVDVQLGAMAQALTVLKLQESDGVNGAVLDGNAADIVGTRYGTDNNDLGSASTLPVANTNNVIHSFFVDCRGNRKRYLQPALTVANGNGGAFVTIEARLSRADEGPRSAAQGGYSQRMVV